MKAKEYYALFIEKKQANEELAEIITDILVKFDEEMLAVMKQRNCQTDSAKIAVIKEFHQKWITFVNLCRQKEIDKGGFILSVKTMIPELWVELEERFRAEYC